MKLPKVGGYELALQSSGPRGVAVSAFGHGAKATYTAPGHWDEDGIEADLGRFGEVSLHFAAEPKRAEKESSFQFICPDAPKSTTLSGPVTGSFNFSGESGFAIFEATRLHGTYLRQPGVHCKPSFHRAAATSSKPTAEKLQTRTLVASGRVGPRRAFLLAVGLLIPASSGRSNAANGKTTWEVFGGTTQTIEGVEIGDAAFDFADPKAVLPTPSLIQLKSLAVAPAAPFSGSATMRLRAHGPPSWSGSLGVELPGEGHVRLAGPGFRSAFCHGFQPHDGASRCFRLAGSR